MTAVRWCRIVATAFVVVLGGSACGDGEARSIPCASDSHCPRPLVCEDRVCQAGPAFAYDEARCAAAPESEGCPCRGAASVTCFSGTSDQLGVGECSSGTRTCASGRWGACDGEARPRLEFCNALDDDCDGMVDEGVANPCGRCDVSCDQARRLQDPSSTGVAVDPATGAITLATSTVSAPFLWIANDGEETVSKLDALTGAEVGRYRSGPELAASNRPSRTAVDLLGDAYVANRAFDSQGSITKFAAVEQRCVDRNDNGFVDTARDSDGNGYFDESEVLPWGEDECVLWNVAIGPVGAVPRAMAVDAGDGDSPEGYVWVATYFRAAGAGSGAAYRIRASDGTLVGEPLYLPEDFHSYGAAVDCRGLLWIQSNYSLVAIDTKRHALVDGGRLVERPLNSGRCRSGYGMTVDGQGRVWSSGSNCEDVWRYTPGRDDPAAGTWDGLEGLGSNRTVAVDLQGHAWVTQITSVANGPGALLEIDGNATPMQLLRRVPLWHASGVVVGNPKGVGIDPQGGVWVIDGGSSCTAPSGLPTGCAFRFAPEESTLDLHRVGQSPYTYSDFLGFVARNFTARRGRYATALEVCSDRTPVDQWGELRLDASVPTGSQIRVRVRSAESLAALATATYSPYRIWTGEPLGVQEMLDDTRGDAATFGQRRYLEVEAELGYDPTAGSTGAGLCPQVGEPPSVRSINAFARCGLF